MRGAGKMMRRVEIAAPMGMRMEAAEAEQTHVVAPGHFLERRFDRGMIAGKLGGLGLQQHCQRLIRADVSAPRRRLCGELRVPRAHGDDAARNGRIALFAAASPLGNGPGGRNPKDKAQKVPAHHQRGDQREDNPESDQNRSFDPVALPVQGNFARPIDEPCQAKRQGNENKEVQAEHGACFSRRRASMCVAACGNYDFGLPRTATAASSIDLAAFIASSRALAASPQFCDTSAAGLGNSFHSW